MRDLLFEYLTRYFAARDTGATLSDFQFVTSGWESDVYAFVLNLPDASPRPLILRLYPDEKALPKMVREARGMRLLHQAGYPVPAIFLTETQSGFLSRPFTVMEKLEGQALWPALAVASLAETDTLLDQFGGLLARLHQLDWQSFAEDDASGKAEPMCFLDELFASFRQLYTRFSVLGFLPVVDWLEAQQTHITVRPAVVHLDFHANNVFLGHDGHWSVIDWTQVAVSDHRADLCWTLLIMGDYGKLEWGERILYAYCRALGEPVEDLDYFRVIACLKNLGSMVVSVKASPLELGLRPETATSLEADAPYLRLFSRRIQEITGIRIPEVEALLLPFGFKD